VGRGPALDRCAIAGGEWGDLRELKRFDNPICRMGKEAAAKLLDKDMALNYNACQAITG
jgi:hypothetical protein